jgi:predicted dehydrogenase
MLSAKGGWRVGIIGCGLMGQRRAGVLLLDPAVTEVVACDVNERLARALPGAARAAVDWHDVIEDETLDTVIIATPNAIKEGIASAALRVGKHVLLEKPMAGTLESARRIAACATAPGAPLLKVGFNHRHYPGLKRAKELVVSGELGVPLFARVTYGHGAHAEFASDWRCDASVPGGGQLLDQGSHVGDLLGWLFGPPASVVSHIGAGFYSSVDDNVFAVLAYDRSLAAQMHVSWTQWKNRFSFDIAFHEGSLEINGIMRSYGPHRVATYRRAHHGAPKAEKQVYREDRTLEDEWREFRAAVEMGAPFGGTAADGVAAMELISRIRSASRADDVRLERKTRTGHR